MIRTQIYLTETERIRLQHISRQTGKTQSELVRQAVDHFLERFQKPDRGTLLRQARGLWKNRDDLPDFQALRKEFDRK